VLGSLPRRSTRRPSWTVLGDSRNGGEAIEVVDQMTEIGCRVQRPNPTMLASLDLKFPVLLKPHPKASVAAPPSNSNVSATRWPNVNESSP
jgi:hypothetical protein